MHGDLDSGYRTPPPASSCSQAPKPANSCKNQSDYELVVRKAKWTNLGFWRKERRGVQALEQGELGTGVEGRDGEGELVDESERLLDRAYDLAQVLLRIVTRLWGPRGWGVAVLRYNCTVSATSDGRRRRRRVLRRVHNSATGSAAERRMRFFRWKYCLRWRWAWTRFLVGSKKWTGWRS